MACIFQKCSEMKHMKLGSKPDIFQHHGNVVTATNDLPCDLVIGAAEIEYHLHKFPLLSKCGYLRSLASKNSSAIFTRIDNVVQIKDMPGPPEAFMVCAKFCYGIAITLNAFNVIAVRCAAQYLEMTEELERGNLIFKIDYFLNSCIFHAWRDCIICLQSTNDVLPWAEDLKLVSRCIDSIVSKVCVDNAEVNWPFTYTRSLSCKSTNVVSKIRNTPMKFDIQQKNPVPKDWWAEDICQLDIGLYTRVMSTIRLKGKNVGSDVIWKVLMVHAYRWFPIVFEDQNNSASSFIGGYADDHSNDEMLSKQRIFLEVVVSLLPSEKGPYSCSFMLQLLKAASLLGSASSLKMCLAKRVGTQLEDASLNDILIPSFAYDTEPRYDVDLIQSIFEFFMAQQQKSSDSLITSPNKTHAPIHTATETRTIPDWNERRSAHPSARASMLKVGKLMDAYLAEIAKDSGLTVTKFVGLAELVPDYARPVHDSLYKAIDVFLKGHKGIMKEEKKRVCGILDCKKLSMQAGLHAAQNECLPLRVIIQVLYFEKVRSIMAGGLLADDMVPSVKSLLPQVHLEQNERTLTLPMSEGGGWDATSIVQQQQQHAVNDACSNKTKTKMVGKERRGGCKAAAIANPALMWKQLNPARRVFQSAILNKLLLHFTKTQAQEGTRGGGGRM